MKKKLLSLAVVLAMALSMLPTIALPDNVTAAGVKAAMLEGRDDTLNATQVWPETVFAPAEGSDYVSAYQDLSRLTEGNQDVYYRVVFATGSGSKYDTTYQLHYTYSLCEVKLNSLTYGLKDLLANVTDDQLNAPGVNTPAGPLTWAPSACPRRRGRTFTTS